MTPGVRVARREAAAPRCPLCRDDLAGDTVACPRCGTAHHPDCADDLLRCSVLGCGGALVELDGAPSAGAARRLRDDIRARAARFAARRPTSLEEPDGAWARFGRAHPAAALVLAAGAWLSAATVLAVALALWTT